MKILIKDININYEVSGVGPPLIFLHGWGCNLNTFNNLTKQINEDFTVYQIDFPGFGLSEINGAYTIEEYANIIYEFCLSLAIVNPIVVGHSFGGRVAIKYASTYQVHKLVLVSTPGIKQRFNIIKWIKIKTYKNEDLTIKFDAPVDELVEVLINGKKVPIIGKVCMDSFMIDVTDIECNVNDDVYIWDNKELTIEQIGIWCNNICNYEVMSSISERVPRVLKKDRK